jgi:hypothetical protein
MFEFWVDFPWFKPRKRELVNTLQYDSLPVLEASDSSLYKQTLAVICQQPDLLRPVIVKR